MPVFLQQKLKAKDGVIVEISSDFDGFNRNFPSNDLHEKLQTLSAPYHYRLSEGKVVGNHHGAHFFTIGQRKGLNIGGMVEPLFVIGIDVENNIVYTGQGDKHPGLYHSALFVSAKDIHWLRPDMEMHQGDECRMSVRVRYRQPLQNATLYRMAEGIYILFDQPQRGITSGQFAAWYDNDELIGSGAIG